MMNNSDYSFRGILEHTQSHGEHACIVLGHEDATKEWKDIVSVRRLLKGLIYSFQGE